ncbi:MAG: DEAD/DEAH box helicase family protein [Candidatus Lokiarchaeota archaeon]|nr:DEAD/DEAH box helicase family protein [Candidatus Lokiarchaeota archaeon]
MKKFPELTFIPLEYANSHNSNLIIFTQNEKRELPRIKEPFFILWIPLNLSEEILHESIEKTLPDFPIEKALTCSINLVYPLDYIRQINVEESSSVKSSMILGNTIAKIVPLKKIVNFLADRSLIRLDLYSHLEISSSMYFWSLIVKLTLQLMAKGSYIPYVTQIESSEDQDYFQEIIGKMQSVWKPILKTKKDVINYIQILKYAPISAHAIPIIENIESMHDFIIPPEFKEIFRFQNSIKTTSQIYSASELSRVFIETVLDSLIREISAVTEQEMNYQIPWESRLIQSLLSPSPQFSIFNVKEEIIPHIFDLWSQKLNLSWRLGYSLKFTLQSPKSGNQKEGKWNLLFSIHSLSDDSVEYPLKKFWKCFRGLEKAQLLFRKNEDIAIREYLLKSFNVLSYVFKPLSRSLKEKNPNKIVLSSAEVVSLLQSGMESFNSLGYSIDIPKSFSAGGSQRIQPVLSIYSTESEKPHSIEPSIQSTTFDISSVLSYEWILKIGDTILSQEERNKLLNSSDERHSLMYWNDQWILVDKRNIEQFYGNNSSLKGGITGENALKLALTQNAYIKTDQDGTSGPFPVQFYGPLENVIKFIKGEMEIPNEPQPSEFQGILRKYQVYGFNWMRLITSIGFGCVLADDMGLGKTIQIIALILSLLENNQKNRNFLVICPTSVLGNWMREINKFSPTIQAKLHYGAERAKDIDALNRVLQNYNVILTSYNILRRDIDLIEVAKWESVILDESQNIKNYKTKQARAVYRLKEKTKRKIALSGTPIENRITELWSLYHFLNPFLLGSRRQFLKRYAIPVGRLGNEKLTTELQNLVNPFLLRRMKTNRQIIPELPDKQETEVYVSLSDEQKALYIQIVKSMLTEVEAVEENSKQKFRTKGLILKALMQLKQVCNHPDHYLHTPLETIKKYNLNDFIKRSGKLRRFIELLEEAIASKSKVLIFTQFKVMGDILQYVIEEVFNYQVPFIHGGIKQELRTEIVEDFQEGNFENPVLLLSLRAGGVGLNLSKASVVMHFDRWWNPAVEDQATDRAYRIGQENKVNVYKMVVEGTIEEKISKMLEQKRDLAESIIQVTGEEWITELSFGELQKIFLLGEEGL